MSTTKHTTVTMPNGDERTMDAQQVQAMLDEGPLVRAMDAANDIVASVLENTLGRLLRRFWA